MISSKIAQAYSFNVFLLHPFAYQTVIRLHRYKMHIRNYLLPLNRKALQFWALETKNHSMKRTPTELNINAQFCRERKSKKTIVSVCTFPSLTLMKCFSFCYTNCASHLNEKRCSNWSSWKMAGDIWLCRWNCLDGRCVVIMCKMLFGHFSLSFSLFLAPYRSSENGMMSRFFTTSMRFYIRQKLFGILVSFDIHWHIDATLRKMLWNELVTS